MAAERTQVGIVGGGPAGLLLSHLLALAGVESVVVEVHSREHCERRQRAGMLEAATVGLLRDAGLGERLGREGLEHSGIYLQFADQRHHVPLRQLTGRPVTAYAQTEVVKDLIAARSAAGAELHFGVAGTALAGLDSNQPVIRYTDQAGRRHALICDAIAGCDGYHGICRPSIPPGELRTYGTTYPYGWLGVLAQVPPSTDQVIYAHHDHGFALHSMRGTQLSRLYLQVPAGDSMATWPDEAIWKELTVRLGIPGWELAAGPVLEKGITQMRAFAVASMRYQRLFLAGDAAHIVPPTGAKGLNVAVGDVALLATALIRLLRDNQPELAASYSRLRLKQVWRAIHLACEMTTMLHVPPGEPGFAVQLQLAQLRRLITSAEALAAFAQHYAGPDSLGYDPGRTAPMMRAQARKGHAAG